MKRILMSVVLAVGVVGCHGNTPERSAGRMAADQRYLQQLADRDEIMTALANVAENRVSEAHIRTMAHNAIAKQQAEVHQVSAWLKAWYGTSYTPGATVEGRQMLDRLNALGGKDFDRAYLADMIHEYQANVEASRPIAQSSSRPELRDFAQQIIKEQSHQASHLTEHLSELNGSGSDQDGHTDENAHHHDEH